MHKSRESIDQQQKAFNKKIICPYCGERMELGMANTYVCVNNNCYLR